MTPLRRAGRRGVYALALVTVAATALPALTRAQVPLSQENPSRLRNSYNRPQASQKLDEAVRKVNSDDPDQRLEGVKDLGELEGETRAVEYLMQAVNDPDQRVRIKAIDTLGNVKAKDATPFLVQQLFLRDTDVTTRQHILAALGKIGDKRATASLLDIVARANDPARGNAIFALGDIGDPAALAPLRALARSGADEPLRRLAEEAIRKIEQRPAPTVVPPALAVDRRGAGQAATP
jgi:HEAT repeat protein